VPLTTTPGPRPPEDPAALQAFLARVEKQDHFQVLGVPRSATVAQTKAAFFQLARVYHPDTAVGDETARKLKEQITARVNAAWQVLGNDAEREAYLHALEAGRTNTEVDVGAIFAAEERFTFAQIRVRARRFAEALPALDEAIKLNPDEGEFYAWRAFARFSVAGDKRGAAPEALRELAKALELSPRCANAHLFSARIATTLGDTERAREAYRACLAIDRRNLDAQRELRLLDTRST
jgi:curved DNA-binding protein CbpA